MIQVLAAGGVMAAVAALITAHVRHEGRRRARLWRAAAEACRLTRMTEVVTFGVPQSVEAQMGALHVSIGSYSQGKHEKGTFISVGPLLPVRLQAEGVVDAIRKTLGATEVEVGDPIFDATFLIEGPAALAHAVLDAPTRQKVWAVLNGTLSLHAGVTVKSRGRVQAGTLRVEFPRGWSDPAETYLADVLEAVLAAAQALAEPRDVPAALAANARGEPQAGVRLACLRTLFREFPQHAATAEALRHALRDESEEIRLRSAIALGPEGRATLFQLADASSDDATAATAIAALRKEMPAERAQAMLAGALGVQRWHTARACIESLARHDGDQPLAAAEPWLVESLGAGDEHLRVAAAQALERVGSVQAVLPLREAADRFGGALKAAGRQAIAAIQARAAGAGPGQISLAEPVAGQVSLARDSAGEVALDEEGWA